MSQLLAAVTCVIAGGALAWMLWKTRGEKRELFAERLAAQAEAAEEMKEKEK